MQHLCPRTVILATLVSVVWPLCAQVCAQVRAQAEDAVPFEVPSSPAQASPWWEFEVDASFLVPIERSTICPSGSECVLNGGLGLGARAFYRSPNGLSWLGAYDILAFDSDSVYEVSLLHALRIGLRYTLDSSTRVQPWIGATLGGLAFGGPSTIATGGAVVTLAVGAHVELNDSISLVGAAEFWTMVTGTFRTRDGVERGVPFGADLMMQFSLGLNVRFGTLGPHH